MSEPVDASNASVYDKVERKYHDGTEVSVYDQRRFGRPGGRYLNELQIATVLDLLGEKPARVLEVGCGTGRFTFAMASAGHTVTGVDYSAAMLDTCRKRQTEEPGGERVTLLEGSIFELPFEDASFDAVLCVHVLMHLPEREDALRELLRVVKPGGRVIFDIRNSASLNRLSYPLRRLAQSVQGRDPWYVWYSSVGEIGAFAAENGARVDATRGMFPLKPNRLPGVLMPAVRAMERGAEGSFFKRHGHIQMIALRKAGAGASAAAGAPAGAGEAGSRT